MKCEISGNDINVGSKGKRKIIKGFIWRYYE